MKAYTIHELLHQSKADSRSKPNKNSYVKNVFCSARRGPAAAVAVSHADQDADLGGLEDSERQGRLAEAPRGVWDANTAPDTLEGSSLAVSTKE